MFFFVLSGFVLAHAYEHRFAHGMGVRTFMKLRLLRLIPFFWLGIAFNIAGVCAGWILGMHLSWTPISLALCTVFNSIFFARTCTAWN